MACVGRIEAWRLHKRKAPKAAGMGSAEKVARSMTSVRVACSECGGWVPRESLSGGLCGACKRELAWDAAEVNDVRARDEARCPRGWQVVEPLSEAERATDARQRQYDDAAQLAAYNIIAKAKGEA